MDHSMYFNMLPLTSHHKRELFKILTEETKEECDVIVLGQKNNEGSKGGVSPEEQNPLSLEELPIIEEPQVLADSLESKEA